MKKASFKKARVLIIGDIMLDRYYFGEVSRISPEAPVPIVKVVRTQETLGGAANVAHNVAHLGAKALLIGIAGDDPEKKQVEAIARRADISTAFVCDNRPTVTKTRIIGAHQQMLRMDFEHLHAPAPDTVKKLRLAIKKSIDASDIVVISDYGKGVCCKEITSYAVNTATERKLPVLIDPKSEDWTKYTGCTCISPNFKEFCQALGTSVANEDAVIARRARTLIKKYRIKNVLVTRSEKGMSLVGGRSASHIHSKAKEVFDVSGAGDTVIATFSTALASGYSLDEAVNIANVAAGIVVGKIGTAPIEYAELIAAL
ncbi:MAG: D-glycero-beta-D-manno-heptose-7-phosphate kinase [Chitinivibrionales bacterium]|nr:D-glycero-beta-D-manno-heptose-7-phosphate kinase [Chitinivibrionales bacterium]